MTVSIRPLQYCQTSDRKIAEAVLRSSVSHLPDAMTSLQNFIYLSEQTFVGEVDGEIGCVWGLIEPTMLSQRAYLWLLTTDVAEKHKFLLVRHSQIWVREITRRFEIVGHCVVGDPHAMRWLKWLGATFFEPEGQKIPFRIAKHG